MVSFKQILISLLLPIFVLIIVPFLILILIDVRSFSSLFNSNLFLLIFGILLILSGLSLFIKSNTLFIKVGKGTLMPLNSIETQQLVINGPYKYVRHPMIISVIIISLGEAILFGSFSIFIWTLIFFIGNIIYLPVFEDRGLEKRFGREYLDYKERVRGWIPKLTGYENSFNYKEADKINRDND